MPELGQFTITYLVNNSPFKQVIHFVETFLELRALITFGSEKITILHILCRHQSHP
jgi:hypothetical protein